MRPGARRSGLSPTKPILVVLAALGLGAPGTPAAEHLMAVQEVFPGTPAQPAAQYILLRMTSQGQTFLNTTFVSVEDVNGATLGRFGTFDHNMANPGGICSWPSCPAIVIGTAAAQALMGFAFDQIVDAQVGRVPLPLAGRVCFRIAGGATDCVAYGAYTAANTIPMPTVNACDANFGTPAAALQIGFALTRTAFNCLAKENSTQFANRFPHPVANSGANANVDADGDGLVLPLDCDDNDATSWYRPVPNGFINVDDTSGIVVSWAAQDATTGSSTVYDVVSGSAEDLRDAHGFTLAVCMARGAAGTSTADPNPLPPARDGRYYAVRARNACAAGSFGDSLLVPDPRDFLDDRVNGPCQ